MYLIGKVLKPQGIKGEVKTEIITSFPEHFEELSEVFLDEDANIAIEIEKTRFAKNFVYIKFRNIQSRNEAEKLRNKNLYIPESELFPLEDDEFYHHQIIGLDAVSEQGDYIGKITDVETYPENDMLIIKSKDKMTHLVPVVKELIKDVDIESQIVTIKVIDGLLG
ncbi:MAG: 16S rRNA processing protein RimM [Calditrichaeota bacterium]|nr:MAG: 16S rRNA processing protein RimM [Calditrichota bacterium]MBL1207563.1 16S rRNA processing protein RimM [Calditrichota bacterium]NOG47395.1 16S rRNA processing protein RimM [Calditrichota bacterium]